MHLPSCTVTLTQAVNDELITQTTTLPQLLADSEQGLIIYFYPKDNTQGCTIQAQELSANLSSLNGFRVVGVSRDSLLSHQKFIQKHALTIALISDTNEQLCQHFGVIQPNQLYGKTHLGIVRTTFVFAKDGTLRHTLANVRAKTHLAQLQALL